MFFALLLLAFPSHVVSTFLACYVFYGEVSDLGWNYQQNLARGYVDQQMGTNSKYVENFVFRSDANQRQVLDGFISDGCGIIITGSGAFTSLTIKYAQNHTNTKFFNLGGVAPAVLANMGSSTIKYYQACYINGIIAGMDPNIRRLGYVGSTYMTDSLLCINAFYLGAQSVRPLNMSVIHTGSWFAPREERIAALRLFYHEGVDIINYDSDGPECVKVAKKHNRFSFATKSDGTAIFGEHNLASQIPVWYTILKEAVSAASDPDPSRWLQERNANLFVGFDKLAVSLGTYSSKLTASQRTVAGDTSRVFHAGDDVVFSQEGGFNTFCPKGAGEPSLSFGGTPPNLIFPCDQSFARKNNFTDDEILRITWMVQGIDDLGLLKIPGSCPPGRYEDPLSMELCVTCDPGKFSENSDQSACELCSLGRHNAHLSATSCAYCSPGRYSNATGAPFCALCAPGRFAGGAADGCTLCPPGTHRSIAGGAGMFDCKLCPIGRYGTESGLALCTICNATLTTENLGASSEFDCVCQAGSIEVNGGCMPCPKGMLCPVGSSISTFANVSLRSSVTSPAELKKGYYSSFSNPLYVLRCRPEEYCPGGPPESCKGGLVGKVCTSCPSDKYYDGSSCIGCATSGAFLWPVCLIVLVSVLAAQYYYMNTPFTATASLKFCAGCLADLFVSMLQIVGVISLVSVPLPTVLGRVWSISGAFALDLDALGFECMAGSGSVVQRYAGNVLFFPGLLALLSFMALFSQILPRGRRWCLAKTVNIMGQTWQVCFTMLCSTAFTPFMCYSHPSGKSSVVKYPSLFCWEGGHHPMTALGMFLCAMALAFLIISIYCATQAPSWSNSQHRLACVRYLVYKFRPDVWWFGIFLLLRGPLLALPVTIFADYPHVQMLLLLLIMIFFLVFQVIHQPWKVPLLNRVDTATYLILSILLVVSSWFLQPVEGSEDYVSQFLCFAALGLLLLIFVTTLGTSAGVVALYGTLGDAGRLWVFNLRKPLDMALLQEEFSMLANAVSELERQRVHELLTSLTVYDLRKLASCITALGSELPVFANYTRLTGRVTAHSGSNQTVSPKASRTSAVPTEMESVVVEAPEPEVAQTVEFSKVVPNLSALSGHVLSL